MTDDYPLTEEQREALTRHGYDPDALPSGVSGGKPGTWRGAHDVLLRPRVCKLDGIVIDAHEVSDLDPMGGCIHCGVDPIPLDELL